MKIAVAQLNYHIGNLKSNSDKIIEHIKLAKKDNVSLIIFSELCICGYPPLDLLLYQEFVKDIEKYIKKIANECMGTTAIIGAPTFNTNPKGKPYYNSALVLKDGKILNKIHKTLLPDYDIFNEFRFFEANKNFDIIEIENVKCAVTICEDIWNVVPPFLYENEPLEILSKQNPELIINISASPFSENHIENRRIILERNNAKYNLPIIYVNQTGAHTEVIFDGGSLLMNKDGSVADELAYFEEEFAVYEFENGKFIKTIPDTSFIIENKTERIYEALVLGIKDYFQKSGFSKAVLGSSGGIDSAVVQALASKALGAENVHALLMPSKFSSGHSVSDAEKLCRNLGNPFDIVPIEDVHKAYGNTISSYNNYELNGLTDENIQARIRAILLMAFSNNFGNLLLNTSNKSELAVGYGTLYGDMCGSLSVIGDVFKNDVYKLAKFINKDNEIIPKNIIEKAPSAELRPDQKDTDSLPDYDILDSILRMYLIECKSKNEISEKHDAALVNKIIGLCVRNEYKRKQFAPIIRISVNAFGSSRRMPIVSGYSF